MNFVRKFLYICTPMPSVNSTSRNPDGRPSSYTPLLNKVAGGLALLGHTDVEIAEGLEINPDTLYDWRKKYPAFAKAIDDGKIKSDIAVVKALRKLALGFKVTEVSEKVNEEGERETTTTKKSIAPHYPAISLWLRNRQSRYWRDKVEVDHTSKGEKLGTVPIVVIQNPNIETDETAIRHSDEQAGG